VTADTARRQRFRRWSWLVALGAAALVGGLVGGFIVDWTGDSGSAGDDAVCASSTVAKNVLPTIVTVNAMAGANSGSGSGEIIRSDGYVLTNDHVISAAANGGATEVVLTDGERAQAPIVGRDPATDLAVLKASGLRSPSVISFGSSDALNVGQPVVALGAPLGLSSSVTAGIVSALGRNVQLPGQGDQSALLVDAIQTDAAINPGNSGGALVDCAGKLVGIPTAGAVAPSPSGQQSAGNIGIGFAIPVKLAKLVSDELIATGTVSHAEFGIQVSPITPTLAQQAGASAGLFVNQVRPGGPASSAGLQTGDVITEIEGEPARSTDQLIALTLTKRAGDTVSLKYERQGRSRDTTVTLASQQ
jgi:putative serine protease PepD